MRKSTLFYLLTMLLFFAGSNVWADTYSHTFVTTDIPEGTTDTQFTLSDVDWTLALDGGKVSVFSNDLGAHFGTNNSTCNSVILSTQGIPGTIASVTVVASRGKNLIGTLGVTVAGTEYSLSNGETTTSLTTDNVAYEFTGETEGEIAIVWTKSDEGDINRGAFYIKKITVEYTNGGVIVAKPVITPNGGTFSEPQTVTITAGEGCEIIYTTDGIEPSMAAGMRYTGPFTVSEDCTVKAIAYDVTGASSSIASAEFKFSTGEAIATIAELCAAEPGSVTVDLNNWIVTGVKRINVYFTDGKNGILLYEKNHGFEVGDQLRGRATFNLTSYKNAPEITGLSSTTEGVTVAAKGVTVEPIPVTIGELQTNMQGCVIKLESVTYTDGLLTDATGASIIPYNTFNIPQMPDLTEGKSYDATGVAVWLDKWEIAPRTTDDFVESSGVVFVAKPVITPNGGTFSEPQTVTITAGEGCEIIYTTDGIEPSMAAGMRYTGPFTVSEDCTVKAVAIDVTGTFSSVASAEFKLKIYTLSYIVDGEEYKTITVSYGTTLTPEAEPTREGYTFSGWSEIPETMPDHDVVVTGTFTINSYALIYFVDGEEYSRSEVEYGTKITPLEAPTKEGYTFSGWSYIPETMPAGDVVVMGSFSINSYTLTYMVDGEVYKTSTIVYGSEITPEAEPTKEGYTFSGWSEIPETMPAGDYVVTGTFTVNSYTLSYIVDGEEYKTSSVEYGTTLTPEEEPTREGYTFSGWSEIPETMPAEDVVITGSFIINQYLLTYILDGEEYKSYKVDYNSTITPEPAPVKKGMTFSGWGEVPETMPACDLTLTGSYSWSKETVDGVVYQVTDTLRNYASVVGTESVIEEATILPYIEIGGDIYEVCSIAEDALPKTVTIYVPIGKLLLWLWTNGYEDIRETDSGRNLAAPEVSLVTATASSLTLFYANEYPELTETVMVSGSPVEKKQNGYKVMLRGLEPDNLYEELATLTLTYEDASYTKSFSFRTNPLTLTTEQPKVVSLGNVVVAAKSNLDDTELNVGFEWRRIDWTDDFASNYGTAYLFEGMMEGYIRNLNADKLWKYRPYYTSNAGNSYYGSWVGIDPSNTSYFLPTIHTYSRIIQLGNWAEIWGYVMRGTDNISKQGFIYWNMLFPSSRRNANGIPSDAKTILSSGNVMSATLENLEYDTEYCYMAFVTTTEGETFYGEPQTFRTDPVDPDAISLTPAVPEVEEQVYDLNGRKLNKPQKGINIIRYSDGTTRKVLQK